MTSRIVLQAGRICIKHLILILLLGFFACATTSQAEFRKVAYFAEWGVRLQPYYVKNILDSGAADALTVINYSFAVPGPDANGDIVCQLDDPEAAYQLWHDGSRSIDGEPDDRDYPLRGHFNQLRKLKEARPHLDILVAIGGWTGSTWFSDAALTDESRTRFVESCIDLFLDGNLPPVDTPEGTVGGPGAAAGIFTGFDIDWEYPITGGDGGTHHDSNDDVNLTALLQKFRELMQPGTLLTMATPASEFRGDNYQINQDQYHLDWFNLMTYDFHGGWERKANHLTNLDVSPHDPSSDAFKLSVTNTIRLYTETYGVPKDKLVVGATMYGRGWKNVSAENFGLYQNGQVAPGIHEDGYNYYRDLAAPPAEGFQWYWDEHSLAAWLYSAADGIFWTLDDPQSVALKRRYIDANELGGIMFWELNGNDDDNTLLNAMETGNPGPYITGDQEDDDIAVSITQPVDCDISLEGFNVKINTDADASIAQVEFFQGGDSLGFDNQPPWSWASFNLAPGVHELTAVATRSDGRFKLSAPVSINVYQEGPQLGLWQTGVSYTIGDQVFYEGCVYSAKRNHFGSRVRQPTSGRYWNLVTCSDCGTTGGGNDLPAVSIISPLNGQVFEEGVEISITADASDTDGTVASVEFYLDDTLLDSDTEAPYTHTLADAAVGSHQIRAVAFDDAGGSSEDSVNITVSGIGGCTLPAWDAGTTYPKGTEVEHDGIRWRSKRMNSGVEPGTSPSKWSNLGPCST